MMHAFAFARKNGAQYDNSIYQKAADEITHFLSNLLQYYGVRNMPSKYRGMRMKHYCDDSMRQNQLIMKNFFQEVATFKSARDKKLRDWFEVINELGAQYIITGKVEFKDPPPTSFNANKQTYSMDRNDRIVYSELEGYLDSMAGSFERKMEQMLNGHIGKIYIM